MTLFVPGVLEIKGKQCLIVADSVSHTLPTSGVVLLEQVDGFNIFCLAAELSEKKATYPGLPIYGYWQTLYTSKRWHPNNGVVAYRYNNRGQYVAIDLDEKTAISGEVVDGNAVATVGEHFNQDKIQWIEINTDEIILPNHSVMTMAEQVAKRGESNKTISAIVGCTVFSLIVGLVSGAWFANSKTEDLETQRAVLITELTKARNAFTELKKTKLATIPNQYQILQLVEELSWIDGIEIPNTKINAIQLSVPYQSYIDMIYVLARHDIPYIEQWLPSGRVQVSLQ